MPEVWLRPHRQRVGRVPGVWEHGLKPGAPVCPRGGSAFVPRRRSSGIHGRKRAIMQWFWRAE